jgi:hypothetical protein
MKSLLLPLLASTALASAVLAQQPLHLQKALQLVDEITGQQAAGVFTDAAGVPLNRYGGSWNSATDASFVRFADLANGVFAANNTKCSPLVTHLLRVSYGTDWKSRTFLDPILQVAKSVASPTPYQYIALTKENKGLTRVARLDQALPGDLLSWWTVGSDANDHTMIVVAVDWASAKPYPANHALSDPTLAGTTYYEVEVVDSSSGVHTRDSRLVSVNGVDTVISGVGTGTIGLLVNAATEIVGYTWSLPTSNYVTQRTGWMNGLHNRLRRLPTHEAVLSRVP